MDLEKERLDLLRSEYDKADEIIKNFTKRQLNFLNITLLLFGGSFLIVNENPIAQSYKEYYPYFLLLNYGLYLTDYYRVQITQGFRNALANKINVLVKEKVVLTPFLSIKYLMSVKRNFYFLFNTIMWIAIIISILVFSHKGNLNSLHLYIQILVMTTLLCLYIRDLIKLKKTVQNEVASLLN